LSLITLILLTLDTSGLSLQEQGKPLKTETKDYYETWQVGAMIDMPASFANPREYATAKYGYIPYFIETLDRESGFQSIQSKVIRKDGTREPSYGCAQIHEPSHPNITREQAMNCIWSIDWAAQQFLTGKATMWTEYRKLISLI